MADRVVHAGEAGIELRAEEARDVVAAVLREQLVDQLADIVLGDRAHDRDRTHSAGWCDNTA